MLSLTACHRCHGPLSCEASALRFRCQHDNTKKKDVRKKPMRETDQNNVNKRAASLVASLNRQTLGTYTQTHALIDRLVKRWRRLSNNSQAIIEVARGWRSQVTRGKVLLFSKSTMSILNTNLNEQIEKWRLLVGGGNAI